MKSSQLLMNCKSERESEIKDRIEQMKADRRRMAGVVTRHFTKIYKIINNKKDAAVVLVEPGGHCGGCHMKLPPQVVNDAKIHQSGSL